MELCCYGCWHNMPLASGSHLHTGCWYCYSGGPVDSKGGSPDMDSNWSPSIHTWISSQLTLGQCSSHLFAKEIAFNINIYNFTRLEVQSCQNIHCTLGKTAVRHPKYYTAVFPPMPGMPLLRQWLISLHRGIYFWSLAIGRIFDRSLNKDSTLTNQTLCNLWALRRTGSSPGCCHGRKGWRDIYRVIILCEEVCCKHID